MDAAEDDVTGILVGVIGLLLGLLVAAWADRQRLEAVRARDAAIAAQKDAETRAERAEAALATLRAELEACHDALAGSTDPSVVRNRLRNLLSGQG